MPPLNLTIRPAIEARNSGLFVSRGIDTAFMNEENIEVGQRGIDEPLLVDLPVSVFAEQNGL